MLTIIAGIFLALHGLVHLLYAGQSGRFFELHPGMIWLDGSWLFPRFLSDETTRMLGMILLGVTALVFITGGAGLLLKQEWWRSAVVLASFFSATTFLLLWDGRFQALDAKGGVGLLINAAILVLVLVLKWKP